MTVCDASQTLMWQKGLPNRARCGCRTADTVTLTSGSNTAAATQLVEGAIVARCSAEGGCDCRSLFSRGRMRLPLAVQSRKGAIVARCSAEGGCDCRSLFSRGRARLSRAVQSRKGAIVARCSVEGGCDCRALFSRGRVRLSRCSLHSLFQYLTALFEHLLQSQAAAWVV